MTTAASSVRARLEDAARSGCVICVERAGFGPGPELAEVVAVGKDWFLLRMIADAIAYDGFSVLRIADVGALDAPHRYADFVARALALRGSPPPPAPPIDLDGPAQILSSVAAVATLCSVHAEDTDPGPCAIGRLDSITGGDFALREVNPHARWMRDLALHELRHVTRVDFLRGYEEALAAVLAAEGRSRNQSSR